MRYLANPDPKPLMNAKEMEAYCKRITDLLGDTPAADDLCARAASSVEQVADAHYEREPEGNFNRDDIRTQTFTERLIAYFRKDRDGHEQRPKTPLTKK